MNSFRYVRAGSVTSAIQATARITGARYVAGGTNILDLMKIAVEEPAALVDINRLPLAAIEKRGESLFVGALARMSDVAAHPLVRRRYPFVTQALEASASPQLRNMASIGGNLMQRTRCPYFRDVATACNKRIPGSGCSALGGVNRMEAVLGVSDLCIATHASDLAVALLAVDAVVHVAGASEDRTVPLGALYRLPGATPHLETVLEPGDLIVGIKLPSLPFAANSTYLKVRERSQFEFALASAAVALDILGGTIRRARVALGGVATIPWRSRAAEVVLTGALANRGTFEQAAEAALAGARGAGMNDYKIPLAERTLVRALEMVA